MILARKKCEVLEVIYTPLKSKKIALLFCVAPADGKSTLNYYINNLCRSANYKLNALRGIRKYLTLGQSRLLCNAFENIQFNHVWIIWMFCRKKQYLKFQKIHHKATILSSYEKVRVRENPYSGIFYAALFLKKCDV